MAGMHRDKCGAASVAGVMAALAITKASICIGCLPLPIIRVSLSTPSSSPPPPQPPGIKVVGRMAMVRNSTGSDGYVAGWLGHFVAFFETP